MNIRLNGDAVEIAAASLSDALQELGYGDAKIATAVNEEFVPVAQRAATTLSEGDRVEVVAPMQGG